MNHDNFFYSGDEQIIIDTTYQIQNENKSQIFAKLCRTYELDRHCMVHRKKGIITEDMNLVALFFTENLLKQKIK